MSRNAASLIVVLVLTGLMPRIAHAQGQGINSAKKGGAAGGNVAGDASGHDKLPAPAKLTPQNVAEMLRELRLEFKEVTPVIGGKYCVLEIKQDDWKYTIEVKVQENGAMWMIAVLDQLSEANRPDSVRLLQLLEANDSLAPCFFFYRSADRRMCMKLEVIARNPQAFQNDLTRLQNAVRGSRTLWNTR